MTDKVKAYPGNDFSSDFYDYLEELNLNDVDMNTKKLKYEEYLRYCMDEFCQNVGFPIDEFKHLEMTGALEDKRFDNELIKSTPWEMLSLFMASIANKDLLDNNEREHLMQYSTKIKELMRNGADKHAVLTAILKKKQLCKEFEDKDGVKLLSSAENQASILESPYDSLFEITKDIVFFKSLLKNETDEVEKFNLQDNIEKLEKHLEVKSKGLDPDMIKRVAESKKHYILESEKEIQNKKVVILSGDAQEDYNAADALKKYFSSKENEKTITE